MKDGAGRRGRPAPASKWQPRLWPASLVQMGLDALAYLLRWSGQGRRARRRAWVLRGLAYVALAGAKAHADQTLDVWRPRQAAGGPPWPLVVYVHGGGFGFCSKQTHWLLAANLAARGFCVVNVNYRRIPQHPFPAALQDVAQAIVYAHAQAASWGACTRGVTLMGESAGANLVLAQALALAAPASEAPAWAHNLRGCGVQLRALLPACGLLDVAHPGRFAGRTPVPSAWVQRRIAQVCRGYAPRGVANAEAQWASPLTLLEGCLAPLAPFPPTWIGTGAADPIAHDSDRLHRALVGRGLPSTLVHFAGCGHAFFALPQAGKKRQNLQFWRQAAAFIAACSSP